jgi:hypothetical protein
VFRTKVSADNKTEKLKAQLVARGFQQRPGIDFDENFPSTVKWESDHTNRDGVCWQHKKDGSSSIIWT